MKISTPSFNISNYKDFVYNGMEIRILMNISILLKKLESIEVFLEMMEFLINIVDQMSKLYPKICHNLSNAYSSLDD